MRPKTIKYTTYMHNRTYDDEILR